MSTPERSVEEIVEEVLNEYREMFNEVMFMGKISKEWPGIDREIFADHLRKRMRPIIQAERQKREEMVRLVLEKIDEIDFYTDGGNPGFDEVNEKLETIAQKYGIDLTQPNNPK